MMQTQANLQASPAQRLNKSLAVDRCQKQLKAFLLLIGLSLIAIAPALALPNPEDKPEEVLRSEIITGARSPIDGKPITASEYAQLQAELQTPAPSRPQLGRELEKNLNLLRLRRFIKTFFPFLPVR
ncbi:MAG: hypothetical protein RBJ76_10935 [Stenomitos frigidus ULC029]